MFIHALNRMAIIYLAKKSFDELEAAEAAVSLDKKKGANNRPRRDYSLF
jgi:hypothetical protein